ncbi:hypothetical protein MRX96_041262, partial [Rhipicephalus microplus]
ILESVKKKNKAGVKIQNKQVKDHLWVFVNCLIENPTFDSQTKENMTLQAKKFGSKCELSDKFHNQVLKCGVVEAVMSWVNFKAQKQLGQKCSAKKHSKLKGIPKLEDANDAGTRNSVDCTLILTEEIRPRAWPSLDWPSLAGTSSVCSPPQGKDPQRPGGHPQADP